MGLLQEDKAIFYHPLNDLWEYDHPTNEWTKSSGSLSGSGKVSRALSREDIAAGVAGDTGVYVSAAAATKVAFCGWFRSPSDVPPSTAAPTVDSPVYTAATSCSGTGVNGATVEVFVDDVSVGNADAVVSGGTWSKTGMAALSTGEVVSARQRTTGELQSAESNEVTVEQEVSAAPTTDTPIFAAATSCSGTGVNGATVEVFVNGGSVGNADAVVSGGTWSKTGMAALSSGNTVKAKQTESGKLQSSFSNEVTVSTMSQFTGSGTASTLGYQADFPEVLALDDTTVVVSWVQTNNNRAYVIPGTVAANRQSVEWGTQSDASTQTTNGRAKLAKLSSTRFAMLVSDKVVICTVSGSGSGSTISLGSNQSMPESPGNDGTAGFCAADGGTKLVVAYGYGMAGRSRVGSVSGDSVSWASDDTFFSWTYGGTYVYDVVAVTMPDDETIVLAWRDQDARAGASSGSATRGTLSGTSITWAPYTGGYLPVATSEFVGGVAIAPSFLVAMDSTTVIVGYANGNNGGSIELRVGAVEGSDVTWGAVQMPYGSGANCDRYDIDATRLNSGQFAMFFSSYTGGVPTNKVLCRLASVSGTTISFEAYTASPFSTKYELRAAATNGGTAALCAEDRSTVNPQMWYA